MPDIYAALEAMARRAARDARAAAPTAQADDVIADMALLLPWKPALTRWARCGRMVASPGAAARRMMGQPRGMIGRPEPHRHCGRHTTPHPPGGRCPGCNPLAHTMHIKPESICFGRMDRSTGAKQMLLCTGRMHCQARGRWPKCPTL